MQWHKDAAGIRNKPFSHFDKLAIIFGRGRATREWAKAPADAVENIEVEEVVAKANLEVYNAMNVGEDDDGFFNEMNLKNVQKSIFFSNSESSIGVAKMPTVQGESEVVRKNKR